MVSGLEIGKCMAMRENYRKKIYETSNNFPKTENYGLTDQMKRAAVSIIIEYC